ncbi:MAG: putative RNA-binding protein (virulence factor B family), partial [Marivirga sp.]
MLQLGKWNTLKVLRDAPQGYYLGDGEEDVLLPTKYVPADIAIDQEISVFIYK